MRLHNTCVLCWCLCVSVSVSEILLVFWECLFILPSNALDDLGVRGAHQQALVEAAEQNQSQLRKSLRLLGGSGQPRLLGVRWRLDYLVAESRQKAAPRPVCLLHSILFLISNSSWCLLSPSIHVSPPCAAVLHSRVRDQ